MKDLESLGTKILAIDVTSRHNKKYRNHSRKKGCIDILLNNTGYGV
jgi:short-subunit dehydrogenase